MCPPGSSGSRLRDDSQTEARSRRPHLKRGREHATVTSDPTLLLFLLRHRRVEPNLRDELLVVLRFGPDSYRIAVLQSFESADNVLVRRLLPFALDLKDLGFLRDLEVLVRVIDRHGEDIAVHFLKLGREEVVGPEPAGAKDQDAHPEDKPA